MIVTLRPLKVNTWSGLKKYRNCYEDIAPYWTRSGRIYTGLERDAVDRLGNLLGLDLSSGSSFWDNFFIRTYGKDLILDLDSPMDELRYLFLKNHRRVKTALDEHKASANFVIINKDEEARKTNTMNRIKIKAISEFNKLSHEEIRKALRLFGFNADGMSNEIAEARLFDIIEGSPITFIERWVDNKSRDTEYLIEKALSRNIIRKNKNVYKYGSDIIGHSREEAISFLEDLKNQDIKFAILEQAETKGAMFAEEKVDNDIDETIKAPILESEKKTDLTSVDDSIENVEKVVSSKTSRKRKKKDTI